MWWSAWKGFEIFIFLFLMWLELDQKKKEKKNRTRWIMRLETRWRLPYTLAKHETDLQGHLLFILCRINDFTCSAFLIWIPVHPVLTFSSEQEAQALLLFLSSYLFSFFFHKGYFHISVSPWPEYSHLNLCWFLFLVSEATYWLLCVPLNRSNVFSRHL